MLQFSGIVFLVSLIALYTYHTSVYDQTQVFSVTVLNYEESSNDQLIMSVMHENGVQVLNNRINININRDLQIVSPYKCYFVDGSDNTIGTHTKTGTNRYTAVIRQAEYVKHNSLFFVLQLQDSTTSMSVVKDRVFMRSRARIFGDDVAYSGLVALVVYLGALMASHALQLQSLSPWQTCQKRLGVRFQQSKLQESLC